MPKKYGPKRVHHITLRLTDANMNYVKSVMAGGQHPTRNSFFSDLLDQHRTGKDSATAKFQDAMMATLMQFRKEFKKDLRSMKSVVLVSEAFQHALAKWMLVTIMPPSGDERRLLRAEATANYKFLLERASNELIERRARVAVDAEEDDENWINMLARWVRMRKVPRGS
jgi:hypothetical protein